MLGRNMKVHIAQGKRPVFDLDPVVRSERQFHGKLAVDDPRSAILVAEPNCGQIGCDAIDKIDRRLIATRDVIDGPLHCMAPP